MESRMDKYNTTNTPVKSRTEKNRALYEDVHNSSLSEFDVNSNVSVIGDDDGNIDFGEVRRLIDSDSPKRRSINIPKFEESRESFDEPIMDTKEYDINVILEKAKEGKEVDYTKERTRRVRETQYKILNDLNKEIRDANDTKESRESQEENLMNLINTITEIELKNKAEYNKEFSDALDLLSDLSDNDDKEDNNEDNLDTEAFTKEVKEEIKNELKDEVKDVVKKEILEEEHNSHTANIDKTLSEINVNLDKYNDFADINKRDKSSVAIKIIVFILVIGLVLGVVYITDNLLDLGLFDYILGN